MAFDAPHPLITRHFATIDGTRQVHYRRAGKGPPVLLAHQSPTSGREHIPLIEYLAKDFTVIAPDTPGNGQSDPLPDPKATMEQFAQWISRVCNDQPIFISDNNGFDWMFICWYFHHFLGRNPFGFSSQNLGSLYKGMVQDMFQNFKHLRKTRHTHHPVDDAKGNAEALMAIKEMGLKIRI